MREISNQNPVLVYKYAKHYIIYKNNIYSNYKNFIRIAKLTAF